MPKKLLMAEVKIAPDAKPLTADLAARMFFGMPLDQLVEDIQRNQGGKYDDLFGEKSA